MWDNLTCWQAASIGEVVVVNCPEVFHALMGPDDGDHFYFCQVLFAAAAQMFLILNIFMVPSFRDGQGPSQLHRRRLVWTNASLRGCLHLLRQRHQTCTSPMAQLQFHVASHCGRVSMTVCLQPQDMYYASVKALYTVGYSTSLVSLTTAMVILCRFR